MSTETVLMNLGVPAEIAKAHEDSCIRFGIVTPLHKACYIGQMWVESNGFRSTRESLNYSIEGLLSGFSRSRISKQQAETYGRKERKVGNRTIVERPANQKAIANILYGGEFGRKQLGNTQPNDGWDFRGGGDKQLTGRDNFTRFSLATYGDLRLVENPDLIQSLPDRALSAGWFWDSNKLGNIVDSEPLADRTVSPLDYRASLERVVTKVTRKVNGGEKGLAERIYHTQRALEEFYKIMQA